MLTTINNSHVLDDDKAPVVRFETNRNAISYATTSERAAMSLSLRTGRRAMSLFSCLAGSQAGAGFVRFVSIDALLPKLHHPSTVPITPGRSHEPYTHRRGARQRGHLFSIGRSFGRHGCGSRDARHAVGTGAGAYACPDRRAAEV